MATVVIAGRPNVGKSTLFNRLLGQSRSIVHDQPGVTRDRVFARLNLGGREVWLVDTGGYGAESEETEVQRMVESQVRQSLDEADVILLLFDAREGPLPADEVLVTAVRKTGKPTVAIANKADPGARDLLTDEFRKFGLRPLIEISAEHKSGLEDVREAILKALPETDDAAAKPEEEGTVSVAFVGRPNVGKSSLINRILREPRLLVSEVPGTTRDVIDISVESGEKKFLLLDTAGVRRRPKMSGTVEEFSAVRALRAVERSDVSVLVLDAAESLTTQDARIAAAVVEKGAGLVLAANKWDLLEDGPGRRNRFRDDAYAEAQFLRFAALKFVSAKTGAGTDQILTEAWRIRQRLRKRFSSEALKAVFESVSSIDLGVGRSEGRLILHSLSQSDEEGPPTFFVWCNDPRLAYTELERYWRNAIGKALELEGIPLRVTFRRKPSGRWASNREPRRRTRSRHGRP
ncbi:MAG: ribosome biogenesis GTPase Der [Pseudomonadota bacterium]